MMIKDRRSNKMCIMRSENSSFYLSFTLKWLYISSSTLIFFIMALTALSFDSLQRSTLPLV